VPPLAGLRDGSELWHGDDGRTVDVIGKGRYGASPLPSVPFATSGLCALNPELFYGSRSG